MPAIFAVSLELIGQPQTALFTAFGSFAMLALAEFGGPVRTRFLAYLTLAAGGAGLVVVGSLCSREAWLAAVAMAVTGFAIFSLGMVNGLVAAGGTAAVLAFVLAVSIPVPPSAILPRLAGWGLAAAASIAAAMLLWPPRARVTLAGAAARACAALASLADALASGQPAIATRSAAAQAEVDALRRRLAATPHRLTGPAGAAAALVSLIDELGWLCSSLTAATVPGRADLCGERSSRALAAVATVLQDTGRLLAGKGEVPRTGLLEAAQEDVARALAQRIGELPSAGADQEVESVVERSYRVHAIAQTTRCVAGYAAVACGRTTSPPQRVPGTRGDSAAAGLVRAEPVARAGRLARARAGRLAAARMAIARLPAMATGHASVRSVWFRNSARAAAGLAIAVYIAHRSGVQYSFWIVLGALSVLRSNALGTGRSVMAALAGTAAGIGIGAAILIPAGTNGLVLWALLPPAVLLATYTPRVFAFAVGQAAFTVALVVLLNIVEPIGWTVGLIRIQDVAIGCAISLVVGLVFWPRGAATLLREHLARAYTRGADYAVAAVERMTDDRASDPASAGQAADSAVHLLDDAFRAYLAERSSKPVDPERAARLVAGAARLLHAGRSLAGLGGPPAGSPASQPCGEPLRQAAQTLRAWYVTLGHSLAESAGIPAPQHRESGSGTLLDCTRAAIADRCRDPAACDPFPVLWASQQLDALWRLEAHLSQQAAMVTPSPAPVRARDQTTTSEVSA